MTYIHENHIPIVQSDGSIAQLFWPSIWGPIPDGCAVVLVTDKNGVNKVAFAKGDETWRVPGKR